MDDRVMFDAKRPTQTFSAEETLPVDAVPSYLKTCIALYQEMDACCQSHQS